MKKFVLLAMFMAMFSLSLSACGGEKKKVEVPDESATAEQEADVSSQDGASQSSEAVSSET
ncbi:MAG: hypothetical protein LBS15_00875 [Endomicrobium sp.]|nr:hypothetical protein [Endomicrobium sp.]